MRRKKRRSTKKRRKPSRLHKRRRIRSRKHRGKKKRRFASSYHEYTSKLYAQKRREDVKKYGSVRAAREHRRQERDAERTRTRHDEAAWRAAFQRRHGRAPDESDWLMDYNYTWRDRYASSSPAVSSSSRNERLVEKLQRLADDPGATPAERANARQRITELS